jgi:hypothetical protein
MTNIRTGVIAGLVIASFYSLYVLLLYAIRGAAPFESSGVTLGGVIAAYYGGGLTAGAIVGILWPLLRWRLGATIVGIVAAFSVFLGIGLATEGYFDRWTTRTWETVIVLGTLFGVICSNIVWRRSSQK